MATNPASIHVNGDSTGSVICNSHASYYQKVTLTITIHNNTQTIVFSGQGESVPMKMNDGSTMYNLPSSRQAYSISAYFEYSTTGSGGPFYPAKRVNDPIISKNGNSTVVTVTSEDGTDGDDNDSYLIVSFQGL